MNITSSGMMRFAEHLPRGSSGCLANLVIDGMTDDKRDRGRQRKKQDDDIIYWSGISSFGEVNREAEGKPAWIKHISQASL